MAGIPSTSFHYLRSQPIVNAGYSRHFKFLKEMRVPRPPLGEQRRIAAILDHADALRAKRRRALTLLDDLTQSIVIDMFGSNGHSLEGSDRVAIGDSLRLRSGAFLSASAQRGGAVPVYGGNGVNGSHDEAMFELPQVIIGRVGAYCGAVHVTTRRSWVTDNALYVSERRLPFTDAFLAASLKMANLNPFASQSGQPLISGSRLQNVVLIAPPLETQNLFDRAVEATWNRIKSMSKWSRLEGILVASLRARAFSGQL